MDVRKNAVVVPSKALIIEKAEPTSMWCVPTVWLNAVFVETGPEIGNKTVIERGLGNSEWIVVEGYHKLQHGMKVAPTAAKESDDDNTSSAKQDKKT